jgi:hypothetical protein
MAAWPDIAPAELEMDEEVHLPQVRTEFEAGYVQSRRTANVDKRRFNQTWGVKKRETAMTEEDYQVLEAFFLTNQGGAFDWDHPRTGTSYSCRFSGDGIRSSWIAPGLRRVECPIEEE